MEKNIFVPKNESIWISALETSADLHGQKLISALKTQGCELDFVGIGGVNMSKEGMSKLYSSEEFAVMGLFEVIGHIPKIMKCYRKIDDLFKTGKIKCVILIDAPDFHFKVAKLAYKYNIPVFYYISPQVWAWRPGRIKFLKKYVKKLLCIFPFEKEFFRQNGLEVEYVGHPLMEYLDFDFLDSLKKTDNSLILLPGSREKEVRKILPIMAKSCEIILSKISNIKLKIVVAPGIKRELIDAALDVDIDYKLVDFENRYIEMAKSKVAVVASGTASLECGLLRLPSVVVYKVSWPTYFIGKMFVKVSYISMTNIIMDRGVFPELIQDAFTPENVASHLIKWMKNPSLCENIREELLKLRDRLGTKKASYEAAKIILDNLNGKKNFGVLV